MLLVLPASSLANACGSPAECAATVGEVTRWYGRSFPYRPSKLKACTGDVRAARALPSAGAKAAAFYEACTQGKSSWVNWDADAYFNSTWQPGGFPSSAHPRPTAASAARRIGRSMARWRRAEGAAPQFVVLSGGPSSA